MIIRQHLEKGRRGGSVLVEMAVVLPVFFVFVLALIEFGHCYLTINLLNAAANQGARRGVAEGATNADVVSRAEEILATTLDLSKVTIDVKDAGVFDDPATHPEEVNYGSLPDIDLTEVEAQQLFIVRIDVPYDDVSILGPRWLTELSLSGQAVLRHE